MSHEQYWLKKLAGNIEKKNFPYDHKTPVMNDRRIDYYLDKFPNEDYLNLLKFSQRSDLTLYKILVSGVVLLLYKYIGDGDNDIIVGGPVRRREAKTINIVLPIKISIDKNLTVKQYFKKVGQAIDEAYEHEKYPMAALLWKLNMLSAEDEFPLFDVIVSLENLHDKSYIQEINSNMKFFFLSTCEHIEGTIEYNGVLYEKSTIRRIFHHLVNLLRVSLSNVEIPLTLLDILLDEDKKQLLFTFNNTKTNYPLERTICDLYDEQATKHPDNIAVIYQNSCLSYKELENKADHMATFLQTKGITRDEPVGIMATRSLEMIIGLLGILKAGGAYLPINLDYPQDRKEYILKNANTRILFTNSKSFDYKGILEIISLESTDIYKYGKKFERINYYNDSAYIIYTSGSSGKPKGVIVEHRGVIRLVKNTDYLIFNKGDRILQTGALEFDASTFEIWGSLLNSLTLCLVHKDNILIPENLKRNLLKYSINTIWLTAPLFNQMSDADSNIFANLDYLLTGGDALSPAHINQVRNTCQHLKIINGYGPTENTTFSTTFSIDKNYEENIPIGRPIANSTCYIMDENLCLLPFGVPGELLVGGDGVARGYLNAPELTAEKFIDFRHPLFNAYLKLYRTGDLARYLVDGTIEFLGRIDQQVKIRGFRIEPGEIENRLLSIDQIKQAVVIDLKDSVGEKYLCAYLTAPVKLDITNIRGKLADALPEFMIPSYFIQLDKIPLNFNGKIDRKKLPNPQKSQRGLNYVAPRNEIEDRLAENWAEVLHMEKDFIGIEDDFFKLGGHSLKVVVLIALIHKNFNVKFLMSRIFELATIRKQAEYIKKEEKSQYTAILPAPKKEYYRLSSAQQRMYFMTLLDNQSTLYNNQLMEIYQCLTDKKKLETVFKKLIERHESLRTSFHQIDGEAVQKIHDYEEVVSKFEIEYYESTEEGEISSPQEGKEWTKVTGLPFQDVVEFFVQPFDLSKPILMRVGLITVGKTHQVLMVDIHHIISDGVSLVILLEELWKFYNDEAVAPINIQYKDFAEWSHNEAQKKEIEKQESFWLKELASEISVLNLPIDYPRPTKITFAGDTLNIDIDDEKTRNICRTAQSNGCTLFMVLLAVYDVLLAKLSGQEEIIIGTVTAGRRHADLQKIIGMFVNTLVLRNYPAGHKSFKEFLLELKERTLDAFENQDYQFEQLVSKIAPRKDISRNPLFDVVFELENESDHKEYLLETLMLDKSNPYDYNVKKSKFELALIVVESHEGLLLKLEYNSQLFKKETAERFLKYYKKLLISICSNVEQKIFEIEMIPEEEKNRLLYEFNDTDLDYPKNSTIHSLFEDQAMKNPDNIAVVGFSCTQQLTQKNNKDYLTYRDLNEKASQLAFRLKKEGLKSGDIVAIMIESSQEMIISLIAVLKAGGAFLPIKDDTPVERIKYILLESGTRFLLTHSSPFREIEFEGKSIYLDIPGSYITGSININTIKTSFDNAYIIYTSGSTGKPKGVMIEHRSLVNLCTWHNNHFSVTSNDRATKYAGFGFDASVWEIFPYLIVGAAIYIIPENIKLDIYSLNRYFEQNNITISFLPTQICEQFMNIENKTLRILLTGGDKLKAITPQNYLLYNNYGPTENTVVSTTFMVTDFSTNIPIGKPIYNCKIYILDRHDYLQPIGVPGELCIGGVGIAQGYLNNPELTFEKFVNLQRSSFNIHHSRLYRTGDLARWLPDSNIEFLGRIDYQVKIRGYRIELGEIENRLLDSEDVKEAVVIARGDSSGQNYLCAYIVPNNKLDINKLKSTLANNLPAYMIPSFFIGLEQIPLNPNGKIDTRALPAPEINGTSEYIAPTNEIEGILTETWAEVLGLEKVGIDDNFFEIGGDSIKTILISSKLAKRGLTANINDFFINPTIRKLGFYIKKMVRSIDQCLVIGNIPLTPIQEWFFRQNMSNRCHFNQAILLFRKKSFKEDYIKKVFEKIILHHDALRISYKAENDFVVQENKGNNGKLFDLEFIQLEAMDKETEMDKIKERCNRIQQSIDLQSGPLVKLGLFKGLKGDYLLIVIHHLVIDAISWRILLEDFEIGYAQAEENNEIQFQEKTHSFKYWAWKLNKYSQEKKILKEIPYWKSIEEIEMKKLPVDHEIPADQRIFQNNEIVPMILSEYKTQQLLTGTNWAYNTEINDILLTALGLAVKKWANVEKIPVNLEGHGREHIDGDTDITRTVGWFATQYPVILDITEVDNISLAIKTVKETLRLVPQKGIGYGILQYLTPIEKKESLQFKLSPEILFNYLGRFGESQYQNIDWISEISDPCTGESVSPEYKVNHKLDIEGVIKDGRLYFYIFYNRFEYERETIEKLSHLLQTSLENIINHCLNRQSAQLRESTPSDLGCNKISVTELERLIQYLKNNIGEDTEIQFIYSLSPMQSGMLFHWLMDKNSPAYFEQTMITFQGQIQPTLFEKTLNIIISRYDILRTIFACEELAEPLQIVLKNRKTLFHFEDISRLSLQDQEKYLDEAREKDRQYRFDLTKDHLTRFSLFKINDQKHVFMWTFHHILMDGWCLGIIRQELIKIYHLLEKGKPIISIPAPPHYIEYIRWVEKQDKEEGLNYWEKYLEDYDESAILPRIEKIMNKNEYHKVEYHYFVNEKLMAGMNRVASLKQVTINTFMQTIWGLLLQRYNNRDDVVFGTIVSGRPPEIIGIEQIVGLFINMVPVRIKSTQSPTFIKLLKQVQSDSMGVKKYEYLPAAEIQSRSILKGELINHILVFENYLKEEETEEGLTVVDIKAFEQTNYDFNFVILPETQLHIIVNYNALVYKNNLIENTIRHFEKVLTQVLENPDISITEIEILTDGEKNQILHQFNQTYVDYPNNTTIQELFEVQTAKMPDKLAAVSNVDDFQGKNLTYKKLNEKANCLAKILKTKGIKPNFPVAIMLKPSQNMIIGLLAILKAGGAFLPIDHNIPEARLKYVLKESGAKLIITSDDLSQNIKNEDIIIQNNLDPYDEDIKNPEQLNKPDDMAYIIYTSGSTGKPKGVIIEHHSLVNLCCWHNTHYKVTANDRATKFASFGFDASVWEIFPYLIVGASIYIVPDEIKLDVSALNHFFEVNRITISFLPTQICEQFINIENKSLRAMLTGGDKLKHVIKKSYKLYNNYGPTENTVVTANFLVSKHASNIPIGKPIANNKVYILNRNNYLQPIAVPGELYIGGDGVARGYLNRPELTAEKFIMPSATRNPFEKGFLDFLKLLLNHQSPIYRTGDLARWLPDGNIEFLGRIDFQVKIRGFRIELGEIETQILKIKAIKETVVIAKTDSSDEKFLCAYFTANVPIHGSLIKENLSKSMPSYMIPTYFIQIDTIPLTPNGKLDRKALPDLESKINRKYNPPSNETEKKLAEVWEEVLDKKVGIHDHFFEIGGDSIKIILIVGRLQKQQIKIDINEFFAHPTIHKLASHINSKKDHEIALPKAITRDESSIALDIQKDYNNYLTQINQEKWPGLNIKSNYEHIMVTGAAGYLGIYLTYELLQLTGATLYLPIRGNSQSEAEQRLQEKMIFYFGNDFYETYKHRLVILKSNLSGKKLDLNMGHYEKFSEIVETIIHSAANVKHFGDYKDSHRDNVETTEQLLEFALTGKEKSFHHISTIDTGSGDIPGKDYLVFTEYSLDEGQKSENVYVKSKFEAEKKILAYREKGLNASIYRSGNMTFHSETGRFQENIEENFFYSMLKAIVKIGFWSDKMKKVEFDLSFVNLAAKAIVLLITQTQLKNETYHICNPHILSWHDMAILLKKSGIHLPEIDTGKSKEYLTNLGLNHEYEKIIERIKLYSPFWKRKPATLMVPKMDRTIMLLEKLGFKWPAVTKTHIEKMIAHCKKVGFI